MIEKRRKIKKKIGDTVYLDLGAIGESKLEIVEIINDTVYLKHNSGNIIDLSVKTFKSLGGS